MADAPGGSEELEFKSPEDDAWYKVKITCGQRDQGNSYFEIGYEGVLPKEDPYDVDLKESDKIDDTIKRFRFLSKQLQNVECETVKEGMVVCAAYLSNKGRDLRFFDAVVKKVKRQPQPHPMDADEACSCEFEVVWEEGLSERESCEGAGTRRPRKIRPSKGERRTLNARNICLLSPGSIEGHEHIQFLRKEYYMRIEDDGIRLLANRFNKNPQRSEGNERRPGRDVVTSYNSTVANDNELKSSLQSEFDVGSSHGCKNYSLPPEAASTSLSSSGNSILSQEKFPKNNTVEISGAGQVTNECNEATELPKIEETRNPIDLNSPAVARDFDLKELPKEED